MIDILDYLEKPSCDETEFETANSCMYQKVRDSTFKDFICHLFLFLSRKGNLYSVRKWETGTGVMALFFSSYSFRVTLYF